MTDRGKLLALIAEARHRYANDYTDHTENEYIADMLLDKGVYFATDNNDGGKWIPVTERLPGCEDVLVVVKSKYDFESQYTIDVDVAAHRFDGGYIDNRWDTFNDWDEGQQYLHVTHWMPLPEPPKGE